MMNVLWLPVKDSEPTREGYYVLRTGNVYTIGKRHGGSLTGPYYVNAEVGEIQYTPIRFAAFETAGNWIVLYKEATTHQAQSD
jgi:hypothetical protein